MSKTAMITELLSWYRQSARELPWRTTMDPYKIWLSEIILQQTRVDQGLPYYERFLERFETVRELAQAPEEEVFRLWQGLGYYSRARNLIRSAQIVAFDSNGVFPNSAKELIKLPGIGPYTAAAIASFAFGEKIPAIDGNVLRVLSRIFDLDLSIDEAKNRSTFEALSLELIENVDPAEYNQAMMELGATVCKPKAACQNCPVQSHCSSKQNDTVAFRPVRTKKQKVKEMELNYLLLINEDGELAIRKRAAKGIWSSLFEFIPEEEFKGELSIDDQLELEHLLSHRKMKIRFSLSNITVDELSIENAIWARPSELNSIAFPVPFLKALVHWNLL